MLCQRRAVRLDDNLAVAMAHTKKYDHDDGDDAVAVSRSRSTQHPSNQTGRRRGQACGEFTRLHHVAPHGSRDYLLFAPAESPRTRLPLIIMLHGCHQDADEFAFSTRMNAHAQKHRCYVAYPVQAVQANGAKCWNWYEASHQQREQGEPGIIADLTQHLLATYRIAGERVFIAGFSAGGAMAATLAVLYPELYAALGIHSGVPHGAARDFLSAMIAMQHGTMASYGAHPRHGHIPTIVFHGDEDTMVHSTHAAQFMARAGASHYPPEQGERYTESVARQSGRHGYTRTIQMDGNRRIFSERWMVHGGGHAWYGGNAKGTYMDPHGPDASGEMVRFFLERRR